MNRASFIFGHAIVKNIKLVFAITNNFIMPMPKKNKRKTELIAGPIDKMKMCVLVYDAVGIYEKAVLVKASPKPNHEVNLNAAITHLYLITL